MDKCTTYQAMGLSYKWPPFLSFLPHEGERERDIEKKRKEKKEKRKEEKKKSNLVFGLFHANKVIG